VRRGPLSRLSSLVVGVLLLYGTWQAATGFMPCMHHDAMASAMAAAPVPAGQAVLGPCGNDAPMSHACCMGACSCCVGTGFVPLRSAPVCIPAAVATRIAPASLTAPVPTLHSIPHRLPFATAPPATV